MKVMEKFLSGRFIILVTFGFTLCLLANSSLLAIISMLNYKKDGDIVLGKEILSILKDVLIFLLGSVSGSFNKIWDSYVHRPDRKNGKEQNEKVNADSSSS